MPAPAAPPPPTSARLGRAVLRWGLRALVAVVAFVLLGAAGVYGLSERRLRARFATPSHPLRARADSAAVARGAYLALTRGCTDCHGEQLRGHVMIDDPAVGRLAGPNLTRGRRGGPLTDREWELAVRHGLRADGSALIVMPAQEFTGMSDEDLSAIVAYARSVPPTDNAPPPTRAGPVVRAMHVGGQMDLMAAEVVRHERPHVARVAVEPTVRYGEYVAAGCTGCHGSGFSGGRIPGAPPEWGPAANITPAGIGAWSEGDFVRALKTGRRPDGSEISGAVMPLKVYKHMDEVELRAVHAYLRTVPAKPYGNR